MSQDYTEGREAGYQEGYNVGKQDGIQYARKLATPAPDGSKGVSELLQEARAEIRALNEELQRFYRATQA